MSDRLDRLTIITRLHYDLGNPKFAKRVELFKQHTLPSLLAQTDQDFDIWIWTEAHHDEAVKAIHPRINVFHGNWVKREKAATGVKKYFIDYTPYKDIIGLPAYATQLNLDSDDTLSPDAVAEVKKHAQGDKILVISLQPLKIDLRTGKRYHMHNYPGARCAPIFALYQPLEHPKPFMFVNEFGHMRAGRHAEGKVALPEGFSFMNIADHNESTAIGDVGDEEI